MSAEREQAAPDVWVGRCYTKARRHPTVVGRWPGGGRMPGGPYTVQQLVVMGASFGLLYVTRGLWGVFWVVDVVVLVVVPFALGMVVRRIHVDGRSPLAVAASLAVACMAPGQGRMAGRPLQTAGRARSWVGASTVSWRQPAVRSLSDLLGSAATTAAPTTDAGRGRTAAAAGEAATPEGPRVSSGAQALLSARRMQGGI